MTKPKLVPPVPAYDGTHPSSKLIKFRIHAIFENFIYKFHLREFRRSPTAQLIFVLRWMLTTRPKRDAPTFLVSTFEACIHSLIGAVIVMSSIRTCSPAATAIRPPSNGNRIDFRAMPGGELVYSIPPSTTDLAEDETWVWTQIKAEARRDAESEPALASYLYSTILCHSSLDRSLSFHLANKLCSNTLVSTLLYDLFLNTFSSDPSLLSATVADLRAVYARDPACVSYSHCLLNYKGFLACQAHRVSHKLWTQSRRPLALALHSRISDVFAVDIHPGAKIGKGVLFDHATGVVVGETAVIGNNVSLLHHVTLGGTGKACGDRHPKIGDGVLIGAGATILGNILIGEGAKIGAGSVVLRDVPPRTTAVGNPARLVGGRDQPSKHEDVPGESMDHTSFISEWSDYII